MKTTLMELKTRSPGARDRANNGAVRDATASDAMLLRWTQAAPSL